MQRLYSGYFRSENLRQSVETIPNPNLKLRKCTETDPITCFNATIDSLAAIYINIIRYFYQNYNVQNYQSLIMQFIQYKQSYIDCKTNVI